MFSVENEKAFRFEMRQFAWLFLFHSHSLGLQFFIIRNGCGNVGLASMLTLFHIFKAFGSIRCDKFEQVKEPSVIIGSTLIGICIQCEQRKNYYPKTIICSTHVLRILPKESTHSAFGTAATVTIQLIRSVMRVCYCFDLSSIFNVHFHFHYQFLFTLSFIHSNVLYMYRDAEYFIRNLCAVLGFTSAKLLHALNKSHIYAFIGIVVVVPTF